MSQDIAFRRIRGRIIPIKHKETRQDQVKKGAALTAAGAVTGVSAGDLAARATKQAASFRVNSTMYAAKAQDLINTFKRRPKISPAAERLEKAGQYAFQFKVRPFSKAQSFEKLAVNTALKSKGFRLMRKGLRAGGFAASTALLGIGFKNLYEGVSGQKADTKKEVIATAAGAGATFALSTSYAHRMAGGGAKNLMKAVKFGLRAAKIKV